MTDPPTIVAILFEQLQRNSITPGRLTVTPTSV